MEGVELMARLVVESSVGSFHSVAAVVILCERKSAPRKMRMEYIIEAGAYHKENPMCIGDVCDTSTIFSPKKQLFMFGHQMGVAV